MSGQSHAERVESGAAAFSKGPFVAGKPDLTELTALIVASYVGRNPLRPTEIPGLIASIHRALAESRRHLKAAPRPPSPAVPIEESIQQEHLVCLEDGRKLRYLTRYLWRRYSLTPEQYRARWGLPPDYPMVAPAYSQLRSRIARRGRGPAQ